uniref:Uncharacterized protein n=1 Tax=Setaria viridis TaxID=4556 RepID=A0A4U6US46_SETVI|nr:hypothetical protein SEVIR_4G009600v2 [Setaria viridis]
MPMVSSCSITKAERPESNDHHVIHTLHDLHLTCSGTGNTIVSEAEHGLGEEKLKRHATPGRRHAAVGAPHRGPDGPVRRGRPRWPRLRPPRRRAPPQTCAWGLAMASFVTKLTFREMCVVLREQRGWRQARDFFAWMKLQVISHASIADLPSAPITSNFKACCFLTPQVCKPGSPSPAAARARGDGDGEGEAGGGARAALAARGSGGRRGARAALALRAAGGGRGRRSRRGGAGARAALTARGSGGRRGARRRGSGAGSQGDGFGGAAQGERWGCELYNGLFDAGC